MVHVFKLTSGVILSLSSSIVWNNGEGILITWTGVIGFKSIVCLCEVGAVNYWVLLIWQIVNEDRIPDVRIHTSHIQSEWSTPRHIDK